MVDYKVYKWKGIMPREEVEITKEDLDIINKLPEKANLVSLTDKSLVKIDNKWKAFKHVASLIKPEFLYCVTQ